jgi:hypothetical protein
VRLALWYTVGTGVVGVLVVLAVTFGKMFALQSQLGAWSLVALVADRLVGRGLAVTIGALFGFHVALVLLRYLLLSMMNPRR